MRGSKLVIWVLSAALISVLAAQNAAAQDPLKVAPDMYKLLMENDRVRVMEVVFKPGSKIAKHSHPDHFVYVASAGKITIHKADDSKSDADLKVGDVMWIGAETHWAENIGTTEVRLIVTELKEPAPAKKEAEKPAAK
jgi:quercetin dioxygenase-like cupin family protein